MIDFRSVRDTRASAFDFIQVRIASPEEIQLAEDDVSSYMLPDLGGINLAGFED